LVFSSPIFLFGFLPIVLLIYYLSPKISKNIILLIASLVFYAWGEVFYVAIMLVSIIANFFIGIVINSARIKSDNNLLARAYLIIGLCINVGLLISFKYANFITDTLNTILTFWDCSLFNLEPVHLPLGISFFTFQAISYIVDVYREESKVQNNLYNLALYISLFPQLIAGPIVRYHSIASQIIARTHSIELFSSGVQRFIIGLSKKMLIANPLGEVADSIFLLSSVDLTMPLAWIGIIAYSLQIYYDFSGYSDMAIGLGRMFGFRFQENFNYPYISTSLREFWRRWHISLSTWFKDYVYIPLGGSRVSTSRVYFNLLIVFLLTGIWHGASWNFVIWGLFHGVFLASEHMGFSTVLNKANKLIQHLYVILIIVVSWVFFRVETFSQAIDYLYSMVNIGNWHTTELQYAQNINNQIIYIFIIGIIFSLPVYPWLKNKLILFTKNSSIKMASFIYIPRLSFLLILFLLSILKVASSTYNPFIYFRF